MGPARKLAQANARSPGKAKKVETAGFGAAVTIPPGVSPDRRSVAGARIVIVVF